MGEKTVATNRKARFEYFILETYEAGLSLQGTEIKSIRAGQVSIAEAYVQIKNGREAWLVNCHVSPYEPASRFNHNPLRERRLLLNKKEIHELWDQVRMKGLTIVPLRIYFVRGYAKIEIGVARGKKNYDKRQDIAKRDFERETSRRGKNE